MGGTKSLRFPSRTQTRPISVGNRLFIRHLKNELVRFPVFVLSVQLHWSHCIRCSFLVSMVSPIGR